MSDRAIIQCWNAQQAHAAITQQLWPMLKAMLTAGHRMTVEAKPISKSRDQEEKYHAIIGEVSKAAQHLGSVWSPDDWKRLLIDKFARDTGRTHGKVIPNLDKTGVVEVGIQSRKFSVSDGSDFIEWLHCWCAQNGVELSQ